MVDTEKKQLVSPRIATLQESLAAGDHAALDAFWQEVAERGSPLIERLEGEDNYRLVTFLWRDPGETQNVVVIRGPASWGDWHDNLLVRLPEGDLWYRTYRLRSDLRAGYWLSLNDPLIPLREIKDMGAHWSRYQLDPLNPRTHTYYEQYRSWQGSSRKRAKPLVMTSSASPRAVKPGRDEQRVRLRYLRMRKETLVERLIATERTLAEQRERWLTQQDKALTWQLLRAEVAEARLKERGNM